MHGFTVDFTDWEALAAYQAHPDHKRAGADLVALQKAASTASSSSICRSPTRAGVALPDADSRGAP